MIYKKTWTIERWGEAVRTSLHKLPQQRTGDMSFLNGFLGNLKEENEKFYTQFRVKSNHEFQ